MSKMFDYLILALAAIFLVFLVFLGMKGCNHLRGEGSDSTQDYEEIVDEGALYPSADGVESSDYSVDEEFERPRSEEARDAEPITNAKVETNKNPRSSDHTSAEETTTRPKTPEKTTAKPVDVPKSYDTETDISSEEEVESERTAADYKYMVVAGSFSTEANANREVARLAKKNFDAQVIQFDRSLQYTVAVGKYDDEKQAYAMARTLREANIDAYVHKRRSKY